jgi:hypothetical protein
MGVLYTFHAEIMSVISAVEIAYSRGRHHLWLEANSLMVTLAYHNYDMISKWLQNRTLNCVDLIK